MTFIQNKAHVDSRIYKGIRAEWGEAPWTVYVSLTYFRIEVYACTGVLITFEWILTAAHCDMPLSGIHIYAGSNYRKDGERKLASRPKFIQHPMWKFDNTSNYDLALIKVQTKFESKTYGRKYTINTMCLPNANQTNGIDEGELSTFFGFGLTEEGTTNFLRKMDPVLRSSRACQSWRTLCSSFSHSDLRPCDADSGGGLVQYIDKYRSRAILIGILASTGVLNQSTACGPEVVSATWVSVTAYIDWILETIKNN